MKEEFKDIIGYEGLYQVSNYGRVKSLWFGKERILKPNIGKEYYLVNLYIDGIKKNHRVNRLVAIHFIPNPDNLLIINHKDGDKLNNYVDLLDSDNSNLEWCTHSYNLQHAYNTGLRKPPSCKEVIQLSLNGNFIKEYESITEAARDNNLSQPNLNKVCQGKVGYKTCGGFKWKYKE